MSDEKVIVTKSKLDSLATSISNKSGVAVPLTIAQMKAAVDSISTGSGGSITIEEIPNATGTTLQITTNGSGGGSTPSATQHDIYFEFSDETDATITAYYDDSFISDAITATTPTTYGSKTVNLAQLDGVTWYEVSSGIPLNTELVDYTKVMTGYIINESGVIESTGQSWDAISDYIPIDPSMTFTFKTNKWYNVGFYNASKNMVRVVSGSDIETSSSNDISTGTLNSSNIPSTAAYIILSGNSYSLQTTMSLIRTA